MRKDRTSVKGFVTRSMIVGSLTCSSYKQTHKQANQKNNSQKQALFLWVLARKERMKKATGKEVHPVGS